jgi:hypothetical protein
MAAGFKNARLIIACVKSISKHMRAGRAMILYLFQDNQFPGLGFFEGAALHKVNAGFN